MPSDLALRIEGTDPRLLLPQGTSTPDRLSLVDVLELPSSGPRLLIALLIDAEGIWHALPLIDDSVGLRRARAGDGLALATADWLGGHRGETPSSGFGARDGGSALQEVLTGAVSESTAQLDDLSELVVVGQRTRVRINLQPPETASPYVDVVSHLRSVGSTSLASSVGDVVWREPGHWIGPIFGVAESIPGKQLDEAFGIAASRHLRGGDDPEPTLVLTRGLAHVLASLHISLATPSALIPQPVTPLTDHEAGLLARNARDAVAEAVVLTDDDTQAHVRSRTASMREAFAQLVDAANTPCLPPAPLVSLQQVSYVDAGDQFWLDPLLIVRATNVRPAAADVASLLRALNHIAHGAMRRLVGGGESVPVERVATWTVAVRELFLDEYRDALAASSQSHLFDERLLLGLEIEAECRALTFAARHLSTWSKVPDAGLVELLPVR